MSNTHSTCAPPRVLAHLLPATVAVTMDVLLRKHEGLLAQKPFLLSFPLFLQNGAAAPPAAELQLKPTDL